MNYEFLQFLHFFAEVLSEVNKISEQLQEPNLDLAKACQLIFTLKTELEYRRNAGVINCNGEVENLCENWSISIERKQRLVPQFFRARIATELWPKLLPSLGLSFF